jgi:cytochrome c556
MKIKILVLIILGLASVSSATTAMEEHHPPQSIELSPALLELLRAEMREISTGMQGVSLSLATGDWKSIQDTAASIRDSYIMKKELTPAQVEELGHVLPQRFREMDAAFHGRAEKLGAAAAAHDAEGVAFHYSRMLESCAGCHAAFASHRFPGFAAPAAQEHHH